MAKIKIKNGQSLMDVKQKMRGQVNFRQTKLGVVAAKAKWPKKKIKI